MERGPAVGTFLDGLLGLWVIMLGTSVLTDRERTPGNHTDANQTPSRIMTSKLHLKDDHSQPRERILAYSHNSITGLVSHRYARNAQYVFSNESFQKEYLLIYFLRTWVSYITHDYSASLPKQVIASSLFSGNTGSAEIVLIHKLKQQWSSAGRCYCVECSLSKVYVSDWLERPNFTNWQICSTS